MSPSGDEREETSFFAGYRTSQSFQKRNMNLHCKVVFFEEPLLTGRPLLSGFKVFRYSFSETIPIFFNRLKKGFFLVRLLYKIFTINWLWIENCENVVLSKIDITMTTTKKKL